jgi:hypothetical protein
VRKEVLVYRNVLGQGPLQAAHAADETVNLIANMETSGADAHLGDNPGHIHSKDRREGVLGMRRYPGANLGVERVDAAGADTHQNMPLGNIRNRTIEDFEGTVGLADDGGLHGGGNK